ncbi:nitroreductase family protein [Salipiger marinus]|uniref:nitroreductase family protein n=1 Tax=Salipiger marinus TaxID=555512 RepID=UPI002BAB210F|nr:nitroreductase family protein [Salipiger manganoxidans]MEB3421676.1 nitroreductase family protein [Salipiger manganoxidans]
MTESSISYNLRKVSHAPAVLLLRVPRRAWHGLARKLAGFAGTNGFLASLYFTFFSTRFYREHQAVLQGINAFRSTQLSTKTSFGGFRRNVHRIEKGLAMKQRRPRFGEGYIGETVAQFAAAQSAGSRIDFGERKWAGDVLTAYFMAVEDSPAIAAARLRFEETGYKPNPQEVPFVPYPKCRVEKSDITFEALHKLFLERRSVRWFEDRPISGELLEKAVDAAGLAPTACNRQPYRFHVFHGAQAEEVADLAGGTAGWASQIPCVIVVVGDLSNYVEERDRHLIYIDSALASMQLMLALQTLGLSTVPINWPDVAERESRMQRTLGLKIYERPVMLIGAGYGATDGKIPYSQKKPIDLMMIGHINSGIVKSQETT